MMSTGVAEGNIDGDGRGEIRPRRRPLVGAAIRRLRTERGLTLAQMGERTGLNVGYLSQVETDKASPSLETLAALADALDVPITWLLVVAAAWPRVVRRGERRAHHLAGGGRIEEVDGGFARGLRLYEAIGGGKGATPMAITPGEEHLLLLTGRVRLRQGDFVTELEPGDYLLWDGGFPREIEDLADPPSRLLIALGSPGGVAFPDSPATSISQSRAR